MRSALYLRVSTKDQVTLNQELILQEFCKRGLLEDGKTIPIEIYGIYRDEGVSGSKTKRQALDRMMQDMRDGKFDAVIVWKLDRLGRSIQHLLQILEEFQTRNVRLIITSSNIDTNTSMGKFFFTVMGAVAEFERELIRERIYAGLERARAQKKTLGRPKGRKDKNPRRKGGYYMRYMPKQSSPQNQPTISSIQSTETK